MKTFWLFVFLFSLFYLFETIWFFRPSLQKFSSKYAPSRYSPNTNFSSVTMNSNLNRPKINDLFTKLPNQDFKYVPKPFQLDDSEKLRSLNLQCTPDSFGYSKSKGDEVFPPYTYPKCSKKNKQNDTYLHIDRANNVLYMNCPNGNKGKYISGPIDKRKLVKSNEVFTKWKVKNYRSPINASEIEFALGSCGDSEQFIQASMSPRKNETAYKLSLSKVKDKPRIIFFLTMDSMSRRHVFRKLPRLIDFLNKLNTEQEFSVFDLKLHNILGFDSISNQVPILGGLDKFVREFEGNQNIDNLGDSAIWTILREKGFISMFGLENCDNYFPMSIGRNPDVDYSVGPFYCAVQKYAEVKFDKTFEKVQRCIGGHQSHYYILNYTNSVIDINPGANFWVYVHLNAAHEATGQHAATLNDDLTEYLEAFLAKHKQNYEIFMFLGADHGMRYGNWFTDTDAYQENKLPGMFLLASKSLLDKYEYSYHALSTNSERLTSKLDLRETALFLGGVNETTRHSVNLIENIAGLNRVCDEAGIDAWDCACNQMELIDSPSKEMEDVVEVLVNIAEKTINSASYAEPKYPLGKHCKFIKLTKVLKIYHVSISNIKEYFKLEIESSTQKGMIFQVNYYLNSDGDMIKRRGFRLENLIINAPVQVKVTYI